MAGFKKKDFEPHVASTFHVSPLGMDPVAVELMEVKETRSADMEGFSLMFKGDAATVFQQSTHMMWHPIMGELALFLGPVHTGKEDAIYYQAIFSAPREV